MLFCNLFSACRAVCVYLAVHLHRLHSGYAPPWFPFSDVDSPAKTQVPKPETALQVATEGKEAVEMAIGVVNEFYKKVFIQNKYTFPNAGRDGETVGDKAVFSLPLVVSCHRQLGVFQ